jgi:hypothetical protein
MLEIFSSLTILVLMLLVYFQRKTVSLLEEEVWFLETKYKEQTGKQPPRMERKK